MMIHLLFLCFLHHFGTQIGPNQTQPNHEKVKILMNPTRPNVTQLMG